MTSLLGKGLSFVSISEYLKVHKLASLNVIALQCGYLVTGAQDAFSFTVPSKYLRSDRVGKFWMHYFAVGDVSLRIMSDRFTARRFNQGEIIAANSWIIFVPEVISEKEICVVSGVRDGRYFDVVKEGASLAGAFNMLDHYAHTTMIGVTASDVKFKSPASANMGASTTLVRTNNEYTDAALGITPQIAAGAENSLAKELPPEVKPIVLVPQSKPATSITYVAQGHEVVVKAKKLPPSATPKQVAEAKVEALSGGTLERGNALAPKKEAIASPTLDSWLSTVINIGSPMAFLLKKGASGIYDQGKLLISELKALNYSSFSITTILYSLGVPLEMLSDMLVDATGGLGNFKENLINAMKDFAGITKPVSIGLTFPGAKKELIMNIPGNLLPPPDQVDTLKLSAPIILKQLGFNPGSLKGTSCRVPYPDMERIILL